MESHKLSLRNPSRFIYAALLGLGAALWASPGLSQTTSTSMSTSTTTALTTTDFAIILQRLDGSTWVDLSITDAGLYSNQARCECNTKIRILVQMYPTSQSKLATLTTTGTNAKLYVGANCAGLNSFNVPYCPDTAILAELDGLSTLSSYGSWAVETTVDKLFTGVGLTCTDTLTTSIVLWINTTGTISPDLTGSSAPSLAIKLDGTPPPAPSGVVVESGNDALEVSWTTEVIDNPDLAGYLVFCMQGDGLQVFNPSFYNNQYFTSQTLCSADTPATPTAGLITSAAGNTTAVEVEAPAVFQKLDPAYLCAGLLHPSQFSVRLGALQGGIPYTVGVAAVDNSGNASPIQSGFVQAPSVVQVPDATAGATGGFAQTPIATAGITGGLGRAGCACGIAGVDRSAVPWGAMLALAVASRLRRRGKRQR
jgi:hypothetical protein